MCITTHGCSPRFRAKRPQKKQSWASCAFWVPCRWYHTQTSAEWNYEAFWPLCDNTSDYLSTSHVTEMGVECTFPYLTGVAREFLSTTVFWSWRCSRAYVVSRTRSVSTRASGSLIWKYWIPCMLLEWQSLPPRPFFLERFPERWIDKD